jgi:hypothetical protein
MFDRAVVTLEDRWELGFHVVQREVLGVQRVIAAIAIPDQ